MMLDMAVSDREHGATDIIIAAANAFKLSVSQGATDKELRAALRDLVAGQPVMAPVIRFAGDLWNILETGGVAGAAKAAQIWSEELGSYFERLQREIVNDVSVLEYFPIGLFSYSSTILSALEMIKEKSGDVGTAIVAESLPGGEGRLTAQRLQSTGWDVTLTPDSVFMDKISSREIGLVILGCDGCDDKEFVNKSGSGAIAALAKISDIPVEIWTTTHKILPRGVFNKLDFSKNLGDDDEEVETPYQQPLFGKGLVEHLSRIRTERGVLSPEQLTEFVNELPRPPASLFRRLGGK
jgi:translation initiation factor 2B subunit (eIF-2B alpha/beta/delta family)